MSSIPKRISLQNQRDPDPDQHIPKPFPWRRLVVFERFDQLVLNGDDAIFGGECFVFGGDG